MSSEYSSLVTKSGVYHQEKKWDNIKSLIHADDIAFHEEHSTGSALLALLKNPMMDWIHPSMYLKAAGEIFALDMLISWTLTFIFNPGVVDDNPLLERLDYNNLCVGWDTFPANIVASVIYMFVFYLIMRFCFLIHARCSLNSDSSAFTDWSNKMFAFSSAFFILVFMIPPTQNVYGHSLPFIFYILSRGMIVLALAFEEWDTIDGKGRFFFYFYATISLVLPVVILCEYIYFDFKTEKSPWPGKITMVIDYSWFACLALTSKFLPNGMVLHRSFELFDDGAIKAVV